MSDKYVAVISASHIWKFEVTFFLGEPVPYFGDAEKYGWENEIQSRGYNSLWAAKRGKKKILKHLYRMDRLNSQLKEES